MLDQTIRTLAATGQNFAAVTTLLPDGTPMTQPMWVDADDEHLLLNTEVHRQKFRNISRDPRITIAIWDPNQPYNYVEVRGEVIETITGPEARSHIDQLSQRYMGRDYPGQIESERVILKIAPTKRQFVR